MGRVVAIEAVHAPTQTRPEWLVGVRVAGSYDYLVADAATGSRLAEFLATAPLGAPRVRVASAGDGYITVRHINVYEMTPVRVETSAAFAAAVAVLLADPRELQESD